MFVTAEKTDKTELVQFLERLLDERRVSIRAIALYMNVSDRTVRRMLEGETPDPETLKKLAEYANYPVEDLFKMVGWLTKDEDDALRSAVLKEIEHLMRDLPEDSQRRILEMARIEYKITKPDNKAG